MPIISPQKRHSQQISRLADTNQDVTLDGNGSTASSNKVAVSALASIHEGEHLALIGKQASDTFHSSLSEPTKGIQAPAEFKQQFSELANNPNAFNQLMSDVFGNDIDFAQTEAFRTAALNGKSN